jgi:cupin superfamily acireductone dioxygenase involved in methionine salvage
MSLDPKVKEMSQAWNASNYHNMQEIAFVLQGASGFIILQFL